LDLYIASPRKQKYMGRHVAPLGHIDLIPVLALSLLYCVLSGEATHTNFIVFCLTRPGLEPTIYRTRAELTIAPSMWLITIEYVVIIMMQN